MPSTLLPQPLAAAAARAQEIARGFGGDAGGAALDGRWLAGLVMAACLAVVLGLGIARLRRWHAHRQASGATLTRDLCRRLNLSPAERRRLRQVARQMNVRHTATLLLCPSLLRAARNARSGIERRELDRMLLRLAA